MTDDRNDATGGPGIGAGAPPPLPGGPPQPLPPQQPLPGSPPQPPQPPQPQQPLPGGPPQPQAPHPQSYAPPPHAAPPAYAPPPAYSPPRSGKAGWIVAAILFLALATLAALYFFTDVLYKERRDPFGTGASSTQTGTGPSAPFGNGLSSTATGGSAGTGTGTTTGTVPGTPVGSPPTFAGLIGTWGENCPGSRDEAITFNGDGTYEASDSSGTWALNGYTLTATTEEQTVAARWEQIAPDLARVTEFGKQTTELVRRCY